MNNTYLPVGTSLRLGQYQISRVISTTENDIIYEVIDNRLNKKFILKEFFINRLCNRDEATGHVRAITPENNVLIQQLSDNYYKEACVISVINYQGVENIVDTFKEKGTSYIVSDIIDGMSLADLVKYGGQMPEIVVLNYIMQIAMALKYVHLHNCLHLDINPENIFVDKDGTIKLANFGVSKQYLMSQGINAGIMSVKSRAYAPIELMVTGSLNYNPSTDIYSLGATLYFLLSGKKPQSATQRLIGDKMEPLPAGISDSLREAVEKSMEMKNSDRPQSIDEFLQLLGNLIDIDEAIKPIDIYPKSVVNDSINVTGVVIEGKTEEKETEAEGNADENGWNVRSEPELPVSESEIRSATPAEIEYEVISEPESHEKESEVKSETAVSEIEYGVMTEPESSVSESEVRSETAVSEIEYEIISVSESHEKDYEGRSETLASTKEYEAITELPTLERESEDRLMTSAPVGEMQLENSDSTNEAEVIAEVGGPYQNVIEQSDFETLQSDEYQGDAGEYYDTDDEPDEKGGKNKLVITLAAVVIMIVAGIAVSKFLFGASDSSTLMTELEDKYNSALTGYEVSDSTIILHDGTKLIYTGSVNAEGKPDGKGNGIYKSEKYVGEYSGQYKDGKRSGKGKFSYHGEDGWNTFDGIFENDGYKKGKLVDERSRAYFVGYFSKGSPYHGTYYTADGKVSGNIKKGK